MDAASSSSNFAPLKPFIKPRPAGPAQPDAAVQKSSFSINELTIFSLASAMSDPTERAAYLERSCGTDEDLRARIDERLAARMTSPSPAPASQPPAVSQERAPQTVQTAMLERHPNANDKDSPALALVPVSAMQFPALPPQLQRQVTFAWGSATLMALAVGALAVLFYFEKDARVRAEASAKEANVAAENSLRDREASEAAVLEAKTAARRTQEAREKAEKERDEAAAKAVAASQEAARIKAESEKIKSTTSESNEKMLAARHAATLALGDSLAALANFQIIARAYADAEATSRQCLEIRTGNGITGWPIIEARALLGEANLQRNANAVAETELVAAAESIETLGAPTNDTDRARLTAAMKRITLFFNAVGRKKEGAEWKRRIDVATAPRP